MDEEILMRISNIATGTGWHILSTSRMFFGAVI